MIKKILKVKNLGKLNIPTNDTSENKNDVFSFSKNTLIFGDNTYGKTTLVSIFKSLQNGQSLSERQKFNTTNNIEIKIENLINGNKSYNEYNKTTWKNENIIIFDNDFIRDNIFSEDEIKSEHLKSLPKILIGNNVKVDIESINKIIRCEDEKCNSCEFCLNKKLNSLRSTFPNYLYNINDFLNQKSEIQVIDKPIDDKKKILLINENLLKLKKTVLESNFYKINIQATEDSFDKKIINIFESKIKEHLCNNTNNIEKAEGFLGYGLKLKKGDICPFCSQDTTKVKDFMDDLSNYFDESYIKFKNEIDNLLKSFYSFDLEKELLSFDTLGIDLRTEMDEEILKNSVSNIKIKIKQKKDNLSFDCSFKTDKDFIYVKDIFIKIKNIFIDINKKAPLTDIEKNNEQAFLKKLELNKYRYSDAGKIFYKDYKHIEKEISIKNNSKVSLQKDLKSKVNTIFSNNIENINEFLKKLRASFTIKILKPTTDNRNPNNFLIIRDYVFEFVDIDGNSIDIDMVKFKETFSDSDKRLLGFAFFLSTLKNDINLKNKIIVLDDPFSSFDINRKEETIKLFNSITNLSDEEPEQKIVLTHEKNFYCQLNQLITNDKKLLKLNCSINNKGSMFEDLHIKKFEADKYYSDLEYINKSIESNSNLDEALPKARECAEYLLKAKYINTLESYIDERGQPINFNVCSVDSFLKAINNKCIAKDQLLNLGLHRFHHSQPQWKIDLVDTNKNNILRDFVSLIESF